MIDNVTLGIKTFDRPNCLFRLLDSIEVFCPGVPVIIANDGLMPFHITRKNMHCLNLPYDSGITYGRNRIIERVETEYYVTLDDDFVFTEDTNLQLFKDILDNNPQLDIVAGTCVDRSSSTQKYNGTLDIIDNKLVLDRSKTRGTLNGFTLYDIVLYFFMGRTSKIKQVGWDEDIKMAPEHLDFFFRGKDVFKVTQIDDVKIKHIQDKTPEYAPFRGRSFDDVYCKKHGLDGIIRG